MFAFALLLSHTTNFYYRALETLRVGIKVCVLCFAFKSFDVFLEEFWLLYSSNLALS